MKLRSVLPLLLIGSVLWMILMGCDGESSESSAIGDSLAADMRDWSDSGWGWMSPQERDEVTSSWGQRLKSEQRQTKRMEIFRCYTNTLANVQFFSTNGMRRVMRESRSISRSPYANTLMAYRSLIKKVCKNAEITGTYDAFCLQLEAWKRIRDELGVCREKMGQWKSLVHCEYSSRELEYDVEGAVSDIKYNLYCLERDLECYYRKESDESRRAYELFRQVIGREAVPPYKRNRD